MTEKYQLSSAVNLLNILKDMQRIRYQQFISVIIGDVAQVLITYLGAVSSMVIRVGIITLAVQYSAKIIKTAVVFCHIVQEQNASDGC